MELTLAIHTVSDAKVGSGTSLDGGVLTVDAEELREAILEDRRIESVDIEIGKSRRTMPYRRRL